MAETEPAHGACCPVVNTLDIIGGKWKVLILYYLHGETRRFNELQRLLAGVTQRMLTVAAARVGARRYCPSRSVSAGAAESGVFADRVRTDIDARYRSNAPLGRAICRRMCEAQKTAAGVSRFRRPLDQAFKTKSDEGIYSQRALLYNDDSQT